MLLPNDVIDYPVPAHAVRVLWIDRPPALAYVFELGVRHAMPRASALRTLEDDVRAGRARLLLDDPYAARPAPARVPQRYRDLQARAWEIVASLQAEAPALYLPHERAALVAQCAQRHGVSAPSVLRWLRRFWERGQTVDALLPDYGNSGARGKTRGASAGVKRGRPRKSGDVAGLNIDAAARATFRAAASRYALTHGDFSRRAAYRQMLDDFYRGRPAAELPTFGQFNYWLDKDAAAPECA